MRFVFFIFFTLLASCSNNVKDSGTKKMQSKEETLVQQVNKFPDSLLLKETLIQFYREEGNYTKALAETDKAIKKDSMNDRLFFIRATLLSENGDTAAAITSLKKAARLVPSSDYLLRLATLFAENRNDTALIIADDLKRFKVLPEQILYIKGVYYSSINNKKKSIELFDQALTINFTFMDAYREKALILYDQQKYEEALQVLNKAVTLQNSFEEGHFYMGKCLEQLNRKDEAIDAYQRALMYDANYIEAKEALRKLGIKKT